jgi:hypothetical protein
MRVQAPALCALGFWAVEGDFCGFLSHSMSRVVYSSAPLVFSRSRVFVAPYCTTGFLQLGATEPAVLLYSVPPFTGRRTLKPPPDIDADADADDGARSAGSLPPVAVGVNVTTIALKFRKVKVSRSIITNIVIANGNATGRRCNQSCRSIQRLS